MNNTADSDPIPDKSERHRLGGLIARDKNLAKNPNYYSDLGKKSWADSPNRKRGPGFAGLSPEKHKEASAKGGRNGKPGTRKR